MNKQLGWKFGIVAAVVILSFISMWPPREKIKLGLDLKGGTSFLLRMDTSKIDASGRNQALQQAIEILRKRLDEFHVAEPVLQAVGSDRILVQLPGLKEEDRQEARRRIEQTAYLEFRLVNPNNDELQGQALTDPRFRPPLGYTNLTHTEAREGRTITRSYYVKLKPEQGLTGQYVERAYVAYDPGVGTPYIALTFNKEGGEIFGRVTSANVGHQLAIILDGELQSAPVIQDAILGGHAQITGTFSLLEAQRLASILENPLQAPVKVLEERGLDPSLGRDSIHSGVRAAVIGSVAVVVFMAVYYLVAGVIADIAVALNILILIGVLAFFKFTLTLPGIAGIVLTIGMAVDANVLIYERVREELAANKPLRTAIAAGYTRAFIVIFDSNFTTVLTAVILLLLGSDPVKGFGLTLTIGLAANLFSAVFVTRLAFDWLTAKGWLKTFKMLHVFRHLPHVNFLGVWKVAFLLSWLLIGAGVWSFIHRGGLDLGRGEVYGIDFKGGDTVTLAFSERVNEDTIRQSLEREKVGDSYIQYQRDLAGGPEVLTLKLPEGKADEVVKGLQQDFLQAHFNLLAKETVGAVVGQEMLKQAMWAVIAALAAIMIYVAFRFGEFSYGLGALVSLVHDVLMTIGWFCLTGRTFSMPVLAAVLTLIGYSINDTIVVYDRIRENRKLTGGRLNYFDLINRSVNETLSRTILTAGTVFICAVSLYAFGGRVINDFAFCFMVGVLTGTYSSIYIASPCVLWYHRHEGVKTKAVVKKAEPAKA
ncbi:MAG TPA: protein translocase subunit SecD [Verrucomicrobiae bacterium]|nr:protein translocase subunit SecD [Verrucomicrobiae bacterium]